jgi:small redox-active disulfide protein 2
MKIQVLGTGCPKCHRLFQSAEQALKEAGVAGTVEKVTDLVQILEFAPWALPALAIDGTVKGAGQVFSADQIKAMFS